MREALLTEMNEYRIFSFPWLDPVIGTDVSFHVSLPQVRLPGLAALGGIRFVDLTEKPDYQVENDILALGRGMREKWISLLIGIDELLLCGDQLIAEERGLSGSLSDVLDEDLLQTTHYDGGKMSVVAPNLSQYHWRDKHRTIPSNARIRLDTAIGHFLNLFSGMYVGAEDMGTTEKDMDIIGDHTQFIACKSSQGGNPSEVTARGVYYSIKEVCRRRNLDIDTLTIGVQGAGNVGFPIIKYILRDTKANIVFTELRQERVQEIKKEIPTQYHDRIRYISGTPEESAQHIVRECDVLVPAAYGAELNSAVREYIKDGLIVLPAANNAWGHSWEEKMSGIELLFNRGGYATDHFTNNMGGIINVRFRKTLAERRIKRAQHRNPLTYKQALSLSADDICKIDLANAALQRRLYTEHERTGELPPIIMRRLILDRYCQLKNA